MFVRPSDPMPSAISFGATQGCTDLVLLDESLSVIPKTADGATGIVAFITCQSATHYLANEEASRHMFRSWKGDDILLYTDDIGCMRADGTIAIRGRSSRNVKINGLFVDLDYVERALAPAFANKSFNVSSFKLVKSNVTERIVLFACTNTTDAFFILKHARDSLRLSHNDDLSVAVSSVRCITEMPFNASYKIDLVTLQRMADSGAPLGPGLSAELPIVASPASKVNALAEKITAEIAKLSKCLETVPADMPLLYTGLNSVTILRFYVWLQSEYEYEEEMTHLFEEEVTARVLAAEMLREEIAEKPDADTVAEEIAAEITKFVKSPIPISKDMPLLYSGLNSITIVRLYIWLQSEHEYEEEMAHLFDEEVTARVLAMEILGFSSDGDGNTESSLDTAVEDGSSAIFVLEKDTDLTTEDSTSMNAGFHYKVDSARAVGDSTVAGGPDIYVVPPPEDETHDAAAGDAVLVVNESDVGRHVEAVDIENGSQEAVVSSYPEPRSPFPSPLRAAFGWFDDLPESPRSPLSFMLSSFITPLRDQATRGTLLDSVIPLTFLTSSMP